MSETVINLGSTQYYVLEAFRQLGAMPEVDSKENLQQFMCGYIPLHSGNSVNTKGQTTISLRKRQHTVLMCMGPALLSQQHMLLGVSMLNSCTQSLTVDVRIKCFIFFFVISGLEQKLSIFLTIKIHATVSNAFSKLEL